MQVILGEKIKELRKRDGRKQEDLANVLGVTTQAVSRWESNVCYPDMNMIPAIANYFHVSIDSLFGYNNDRDKKIQELSKAVNRYFIDNGMEKNNNTHIIELLRSGLEEFPGEPELLRLLAMALGAQGQKESEKPNKYLTEAAEIYEGLLKEKNSINPQHVISPLLNIYTAMEDYEKAERKAQEQPSIQICKEILLASVYENKKSAVDGKKSKQFQGEAILSLLHELEMIILKAVVRDEKFYNSQDGLKILVALRKLYETVFDANDFGKFHSDMCMLDLTCASLAKRMDDYDNVYTYFDSAYNHYIEYAKIMTEGSNNGCIEECYDSPLLNEVGNTSIPIVVCRPEYFMHMIDSLPEKMQTEFRNNPRYTSLFEKNE